MEVFMRHVPQDLTEPGLEKQLRPVMKSLSINDWRCQKMRNKPFGTITFLHKADADRFQFQHRQHFAPGHGGRTQFQARLHIMGTPVYCQDSKNQPNPILLRGLAKSAEDRVEAQQRGYQRSPDKIVFSTNEFSCGVYRYVDQQVYYVPEIRWDATGGLAKFLKNHLLIEFRNGPNGNLGFNKVEIPYRIIEGISVSSAPTGLTITLWEAPRFFSSRNTTISSIFSLFDQGNHFNPSKTRLPSLPHIHANHQAILGQALVYRIGTSPVEFDEKVDLLSRRNLLSIVYRSFPTPVLIEESLSDELRRFYRAIQGNGSELPFSLLFQLEALVRNNYLLPSTVITLLHSIKSAILKDATSISAAAIRKLFAQIPFPGQDVDASVFEVNEIYSYILKNEEELKRSTSQVLVSQRARQNLALVYKATITPTNITLHGPEPEAKNRILRRYPNHLEYFLRVQFCDEDGSDLQFNASVSNEEIYTRFKGIFKTGINIAGRNFGFLGFSHSSLRSHSAWFMAPFFYEGDLVTYFAIINRIGSFDSIRCPARCAARIGQAFSETPLAISMKAHGIRHMDVPDVRSMDGSRVFSDGVGLISQDAMQTLHSILPNRKNSPTCFQIRWGGAKGMLSLDRRLRGKVVQFRPSLIKFSSQDTENLEICDYGKKPYQMHLNRQMIKILEDMGVTNTWFLQQQNQAIRSLQLFTAHIANTVNFLQKQRVGLNIGFPKLIRRLDKMQIRYHHDRFLRSVVEALLLQELRLIKHKAKIPIADGVTLFGVMDETGFLGEGEIYITFDKTSFIKTSYLDLDRRKMIVTRSPALHSGDIQTATNILPPVGHPLRALKNCVVFSQHGLRDLPSELSGGDLDGDIYNLIWDKVAVRQGQTTYKPADYPRVEPRNIDRVVTAEDMTDFFVQFMATDQLGMIAVKHMIFADQRDAGTDDPDCKVLAHMHSTGVDYSKTGIPIDMSLLKGLKMNKYRPDFLAPVPQAVLRDRSIILEEPTLPATADGDEDEESGPNYLFYRSEKVLGQLYRDIDERKIWHDEVQMTHIDNTDIWQRVRLNLQDEANEYWSQQFRSTRANIDKAWEIRHAYEDAISTAMYDFSDHAARPLSELEVFTGSIFNKAGTQTNRQRDKSVRLKDEFDRIIKWIASMIRRKEDLVKLEYDDDDEEDDDADAPAIFTHSDGSDEALALSLTCLDIGCRMDLKDGYQGPGGRTGKAFDSFKVVAACCVVKELDAAKGRRVVVDLTGED